MRLVTTLTLALLLAPAALAQPCDPAEATYEIPCPDTTDWRRYMPLAVGNEWQFREAIYYDEFTHWGWRITGTAEVEGRSYFELRGCSEDEDGGASCGEPRLVRYSDEYARVVQYHEEGDTWWPGAHCDLALPFGGTPETESEFYECEGVEGMYFGPASGAYGATLVVSPDTMSGDTRKHIGTPIFTGTTLYAGIGPVDFVDERHPEATELVYARIDGKEVGRPAFSACDPAEAYEIPCPDTTGWKRYFPLAVGNQWQYERSAFCGVEGFPPCRFGSEIIGSEVIEDVQYFLIRRCTEELSGEVSCGEAQPIRYDEELRTIVYWAANGTVHPRTYNLALPFGYPVEWEVDGEPFELHVDGRYGVTFDLGAGPSLVGTSKAFASIGGGVSFFSGIGETGSWGDGSMVSEDLTYARVAGVEYGVQAFGFPSSDEPGASAPAAFALRSVYPNPAREAATVAYTLGRAQDVTLEVLDVLGRVVRTEEVGPQAAGPHEARLATDGLPSGLYLVRLHGDGVEATRRLVVLR